MSPKEHPYRPEIDGLRMIAVVAVVLYHFGMPGLSGGFAGVDVFFVISGYLIGGILWRETRATGRISLARFYIRRVKRLAPAFFAMALAASVIAWLVLLPFEFREYGKSLIAATVYLSNVLFFRGAGYFDTAAETKVLPAPLATCETRPVRQAASLPAQVKRVRLASSFIVSCCAPTQTSKVLAMKRTFVAYFFSFAPLSPTIHLILAHWFA